MVAGRCSDPDCDLPAYVELDGKLYCARHGKSILRGRPCPTIAPNGSGKPDGHPTPFPTNGEPYGGR